MTRTNAARRGILTLVVLGLGGAWVAAGLGGARATSTRSDSFAQGYQAYKAGRYNLAIARLSEAAREQPVLGDYACFYLGQAELAQHAPVAAAVSFQRLCDAYPQSLFRPRAELSLATIALAQGQYQAAHRSALLVQALTDQPALAAQARLISGRALIGQARWLEGYRELQALRHAYPRSAADGPARAAQQVLLTGHPGLIDTSTLAWLHEEAQLSLTEGQADLALAQARAALDLAPPPAMRASLLWIVARALRGHDDAQEHALRAYLAFSPAGDDAPAALFDLARLLWHRDQPAQARGYFLQLVTGFPHSSLASGALMRAGRTLEDEDQLDQARTIYRQLNATYPASEAAANARFRSAWLLYAQHRFGAAAAAFRVLAAQVAEPSERDMYRYWQARALAQQGDRAAANAIWVELATSTQTNYYPELARQRIGASLPLFPAADFDPPEVPAGLHAERLTFHWQRALTLKAMELYSLEVPELRRLLELAEDHTQLRMFLLGEFLAAQDYYDVTVLASRMAASGELSPVVAERLRYPRAYWELISQAATRTTTHPYLLIALTRQESLFDPAAHSFADARGLMQLLPSTAQIIARRVGLPGDALDLYDPALNIQLGSANLRILLDAFGGDQFKAVAAYNAGQAAVRRWEARFNGPDDEWVENIDYNETRNYVKKVIGGMREYQILYPRQPGV